MIVAHLSDLHLGFRAYGRVESGMDLRERDVAAAFERGVRELVRLAPDLVVVAGDVFDRPEPAASAVVTLARGLEVLRSSLPATPVLMVAGPRDTPRGAGDPGALAVLDAFSNVEAATGLTRSILIDRLDLHVCLVPHRAAVRQPPVVPEPDPRRRWNVLVLHAHGAPLGSAAGVHVDAADWDYVALGGEHRPRQVGARVRYCGSLERVALDPWDEATDEKGFLTVDLASGAATFHPVPGRPVAALAPVKVGSGDPERIRRRVREVTQEVPGGIDGKIVRLRLQGATPHDLLALQGPTLQELRARALHLSVEAGRELRAPPEAWLPGEAPRTLREAVSIELERDGRLDEATRTVMARWIPDGTNVLPVPYGTLEALDGDVPGLGRVSTSVPPGITAFFGGGGRARRAVADLIARRVGGGGPPALGRLWRSMDGDTLEGAFESAVAAVAESRGIGLIDEALARAAADDRTGRVTEGTAADRAAAEGTAPEGGAVGVGDRTAHEGAVPEEPAADPTGRAAPGRTAPAAAGTAPDRIDADRARMELRLAERELRELRADAAEVDGDLEVAIMDWLRERQDAETTLHAYRDRARELRTRLRRMEAAGPDAPCPTCGRVLEGHHEQVLRELREEWEAIVQDGSWWRSRWTQLELKPAALRDLESRSVRLHAALEAGSERSELLRARAAAAPEGGPAEPLRPDPSRPDSAEAAVMDALSRVRAARRARARELVLDRAARFLCRLSGGRILAVTHDEDRLLLQDTAGVLSPLSDEDLALAGLTFRLTAASLVAAGGRVLASLPIGEPFDRVDEETRHRILILLRALLREIPRMVVVTRGAGVDARPELFDFLLEVRDDGTRIGPLLRPTPAGPGRIALRDGHLAGR